MVGYLYPDGAPLDVQLIVLDKDGTLVDFNKTWLPGYLECAQRVAEEAGEPALAQALLKAGGWVEEDGKPPYILQDGFLLHATLDEIVRQWIETQPLVATRWAGEEGFTSLLKLAEDMLGKASVRDCTPLGPVEPTLRALRAQGIQLAVVTNDQEEPTRKQLEHLGWSDLFVKVVGADSGYGGKPAPGGVRACVEAAGVAPDKAIMIGDAAGDITAGRRAGCVFTVAIWPDEQPMPAGLADAAARIPDLSQLPAALTAAGWVPPPGMGGGGGASSEDALAEATAKLSVEEGSSGSAYAKGAAAEDAAAQDASAAAASVDGELTALVDGMLPQAKTEVAF